MYNMVTTKGFIMHATHLLNSCAVLYPEGNNQSFQTHNQEVEVSDSQLLKKKKHQVIIDKLANVIAGHTSSN